MENDDYEFKPVKARAIQAPPSAVSSFDSDISERFIVPSNLKSWMRRTSVVATVSFVAGGAVVAGAISLGNPANFQTQSEVVRPAIVTAPSSSATPSTSSTPTPTPSYKVKRGSYGVVTTKVTKKTPKKKKKKKRVVKATPLPTPLSTINPNYVRRIIG